MKKIILVILFFLIFNVLLSCIDNPNNWIETTEKYNYSSQKVLNNLNQIINDNPISHLSSNDEGLIITEKISFKGIDYYSTEEVLNDNDLTITEKQKIIEMFDSVFGINIGNITIKSFMEKIIDLSKKNIF
jgi:hypothetical protein